MTNKIQGSKIEANGHATMVPKNSAPKGLLYLFLGIDSSTSAPKPTTARLANRVTLTVPVGADPKVQKLIKNIEKTFKDGLFIPNHSLTKKSDAKLFYKQLITSIASRVERGEEIDGIYDGLKQMFLGIVGDYNPCGTRWDSDVKKGRYAFMEFLGFDIEANYHELFDGEINDEMAKNALRTNDKIKAAFQQRIERQLQSRDAHQIMDAICTLQNSKTKVMLDWMSPDKQAKLVAAKQKLAEAINDPQHTPTQSAALLQEAATRGIFLREEVVTNARQTLERAINDPKHSPTESASLLVTAVDEHIITDEKEAVDMAIRIVNTAVQKPLQKNDLIGAADKRNEVLDVLNTSRNIRNKHTNAIIDGSYSAFVDATVRKFAEGSESIASDNSQETLANIAIEAVNNNKRNNFVDDVNNQVSNIQKGRAEAAQRKIQYIELVQRTAQELADNNAVINSVETQTKLSEIADKLVVINPSILATNNTSAVVINNDSNATSSSVPAIHTTPVPTAKEVFISTVSNKLAEKIEAKKAEEARIAAKELAAVKKAEARTFNAQLDRIQIMQEMLSGKYETIEALRKVNIKMNAEFNKQKKVFDNQAALLDKIYIKNKSNGKEQALQDGRLNAHDGQALHLDRINIERRVQANLKAEEREGANALWLKLSDAIEELEKQPELVSANAERLKQIAHEQGNLDNHFRITNRVS